MITQEKGHLGEEKALAYLNNLGFKLVTKNFRCRLGEIDLIMRDKEYLVFIEVRSRSSHAFGGGIASINSAKKQKILKTAAYYLMTHKAQNEMPLRFDVISIDGKFASITWLKDAFGIDY